MLLTGATPFSYEIPNKYASCIGIRWTRREVSNRKSRINATRSRSSLLEFTGQKQSRHRRHSWCEDRHHLQARRSHFEQAQRENRTSAAVVALEKRRSATQRCEERSRKPWSALAGGIATQLGGPVIKWLRNFRRVFDRMMRRSLDLHGRIFANPSILMIFS